MLVIVRKNNNFGHFLQYRYNTRNKTIVTNDELCKIDCFCIQDLVYKHTRPPFQELISLKKVKSAHVQKGMQLDFTKAVN